MVVNREVDRLHELVARKLHELAGGERDGGQAEHRRVPAARHRVGEVRQTAVDLIGDNDGGDELRAIRSFGLGDREAWRDMIARMHRSRRRSVDIIEVQVPHGGAIGEGGRLGRGPQGSADDRGRPCAPRKGGLPARSDRPFVERRDPASQRINDMSFDALHGGGVDIAKAQAARIVGKLFGERLRTQPQCAARQSWERDGAHRQTEEFATSEFHAADPPVVPVRR
jgi:hypothetical protein